MAIIPPTSERVRLHTTKVVNKKIHNKALANIKIYQGKGKAEINNRLREFEREWDTERVLETDASAIILVSTILVLH